MGRTFLELSFYAVDLEKMFLWHQSALLDRDFEGAEARFELYRTALAKRLWEEERYLFPVYEQTSRWPGDDLIEQLRAEHRVITQVLQTIHRHLASLALIADDEERTIATLDLLEIEGDLKRRLAADTRRKNNIFYPALDRRTADEVKTTLIDHCTRRAFPGPGAHVH